MTPSIFKPSHFSINRRHAVALLLSGFAMGGAQAQVFDFYVAETAASNSASTLLKYSYDLGNNTATAGSTFSTGLNGLPASSGTAQLGALQYTGDGTGLSYAGFDTSSTKSVAAIFNPSTTTFDTTTKVTGTVRANYAATSTSGFYTATGAVSLANVAKGGTAVATVVSNTGTTGTSANGVTYNSGTSNLYFTRNSTAGAVFTPTTNGSGLFTTTKAFTALTGTGWPTTHVLNGLDFLGNDNLFVADLTGNSINLFSSADPTQTNNWNLKFTLSLGTITSTNESVQQLSVTQLDANNALVFFTTNGNVTALTAGGTSTFNVVPYNSTTGFGTVQNLGSSTTQYFSGIASVDVVPEPGTYAMLGLGLGLLGLMTLRRKTSQ